MTVCCNVTWLHPRYTLAEMQVKTTVFQIGICVTPARLTFRSVTVVSNICTQQDTTGNRRHSLAIGTTTSSHLIVHWRTPLFNHEQQTALTHRTLPYSSNDITWMSSSDVMLLSSAFRMFTLSWSLSKKKKKTWLMPFTHLTKETIFHWTNVHLAIWLLCLIYDE